jgi:hypothetical protein
MVKQTEFRVFKDTNKEKLEQYLGLKKYLEEQNRAAAGEWATFVAKIEQGLAWSCEPAVLDGVEHKRSSTYAPESRVRLAYYAKPILDPAADTELIAEFYYGMDIVYLADDSQLLSLENMTQHILKNNFRYNIFNQQFNHIATLLYEKTTDLLNAKIEQTIERLKRVWL